MSDGQRVKFQSLANEEFQKKLRLGLKSPGEVFIYIWNEAKPEEALKLEVVSCSEKGLLELKNPEEKKPNTNGKNYLYLGINGVHYFSEGITIFTHDEILNLDLKTLGKVYSMEQRDQERLLTIPHHQVYLYLKTEAENVPSNVLPLPHFKTDLKKFVEFERQLSKTATSDELVGFRVLDLSLNGLSLIANKEELELFKSFQERPANGTLMFDESSFYLKKIEYVHSISYVNPRARLIPMFKVGLSVDIPEELKTKIVTFLDFNQTTISKCYEFENFILGRSDLVKV